MNDAKRYEQILGLQPPWSVQSVALKKAEGIMEIEVVCAETLRRLCIDEKAAGWGRQYVTIVSSADTLKGTRQLWLYGPENRPRRWAGRFKVFREVATQTARAWKVKDLLRSFWGCGDENDALAFFRKWCREAMATRLEPVKRVVRLFKEHWSNIVTYFRHHLYHKWGDPRYLERNKNAHPVPFYRIKHSPKN